MQKISNFFYGIGQGIAGIFRNRLFSLASMATMAACLFIFSIFYSVFVNFEHILKEAESNVGITVFFDEGTTDEEIAEIGNRIGKRAEVGGIEFTSAQEAWEQYKTTKLSPELVESFGNDNPLEDSASYTVYLNDVTMQDALVKYIRSLPKIRKVNDAANISESLAGINSVISVVSGVIIVVLLLVAAFLISITVSMGVSVRKKEISIMKLIGATDSFISIPFVVEGIIIGLVGAAIPIVSIRYAYPKLLEVLAEKFTSVFNMVSFVDIESVLHILVPVTLVIGVGIGFIGSKMTLKKQLRRIEVS